MRAILAMIAMILIGVSSVYAADRFTVFDGWSAPSSLGSVPFDGGYGVPWCEEVSWDYFLGCREKPPMVETVVRPRPPYWDQPRMRPMLSEIQCAEQPAAVYRALVAVTVCR